MFIQANKNSALSFVMNDSNQPYFAPDVEQERRLIKGQLSQSISLFLTNKPL